VQEFLKIFRKNNKREKNEVRIKRRERKRVRNNKKEEKE